MATHDTQALLQRAQIAINAGDADRADDLLDTYVNYRGSGYAEPELPHLGIFGDQFFWQLVDEYKWAIGQYLGPLLPDMKRSLTVADLPFGTHFVTTVDGKQGTVVYIVAPEELKNGSAMCYTRFTKDRVKVAASSRVRVVEH